MDFLDADPTPREKSRVECLGQGDPAVSIQVSIKNAYPKGGPTGRIQQAFFVNENEVFNHDVVDDDPIFIIKSTSTGYLNFVFELRALDPGKDWGWGRMGSTEIGFLPIQP